MAIRSKSDRMAWFKLDAGTFIGETSGLSSAHVGIYARLIALYWAFGNKLPDDPILRRRIGPLTAEDEAVLPAVLAEFFPDGKHRGLDSQLLDVQANSRKQSESAVKRWEKDKAKPPHPTPEPAADDTYDF